MPRDRVRCVDCREPIPSDARICPHCKSVQPSPLIDATVVALGVFCFVFGIILGFMTRGTIRLVGYTLIVVGIGLAVGGYTRYIDRQAERRAR
ncbi:hypothetical protein JCM17823_05350 [Halorubrum gandharaense]